jgi:hypothetical protein
MIGVFTGRSYGQRVENVTFIRIETELVENLHLFQPSDWMVLTCLTMHIGQTNVCWPSLAKIATQTGLSEQTVKTAIKRLCTVTVGNQRVLAVCERRTASGRQTSNLYVVMPTDEQVAEFESQGEGTNFISEEGTDFIPPITLNKTHKELIPPIVPQRKKRDVQLPKTDDPAHQLFVMFRRARGWQDDYSVGEWQGVHLVLREMVRSGVTADEVYQRTYNLMGQWKSESMVTLRALWKHWSSAERAQTTLPSAMRKANDISNSASNALRFVQGRD